MKCPDEVKKLVEAKFRRNYKDWFRAEISAESTSMIFPIAISLSIPTQKQALELQDETRTWISLWESWEKQRKTEGSIKWVERSWHLLGTQRVPEKLVLYTAEDAVSWLSKTEGWLRAVRRCKAVAGQWPVVLNILPKYYNFFACSNEIDCERLMSMLRWLSDNPTSNLYPRQIPVAGLDSKWLEANKTIVSDLMSAIQNKPITDFYTTCGLKSPQSQLIRIRILDEKLRNQVGCLDDISVPVESAANMLIKPTFVYVVENIQTGLAFGDIADAVVIMGLGNGIDALAELPWLCGAKIIYWGDIDTYGLAILSRVRRLLPDTEAILMDEETLLKHRDLWVEEQKQHPAIAPPLLTDSEQKLYNSLKNNVYGENIRLEQERIQWDVAMESIENAVEAAQMA